MSEQQGAFIVVPVQAVGGQEQASTTSSAQLSSTIESAMKQSGQTQNYNHQETKGPLKQIIAQQDSLYKYISWEDPVRTFGFYLGVMGVLFGCHYLPLTKFALKIGAIGLGAVSLVEYSGRMFGPNTFLSRVRPKEYSQVPESTLNATLKDVHDFVQYLAVQAQRVIWGQDLGNTFATFIAFSGLYWLAKILSPFWLAVLGVHSLFVAPLVNSPRGRQVTQDAVAGAGNLANAAAEKGTALAQNGQAKAQQLSSQASEAARNVGQRGQELVESGKQATIGATQQVQDSAAGVTRHGGDLAQNDKGSTFEHSNQASNVSNSMTDNVERPLGRDTNPFRSNLGEMDPSSSRTEPYNGNFNGEGGNYTHSGRDSYYTNVGEGDSGIMNRGPPVSHRTFETPRNVAPPVPPRKPVSSTDPAFEYEGTSATTYQ